MDTKGLIDSKDIAIIEALQSDGRMSMSEVGKLIGLSQPATSERLKKLEAQGVIQGYTVTVDTRALGLSLTAIIRLQTTHEHIQDCLKRFRNVPNILEVYRVTGDYCFILKVIVELPEHLEKLVDSIACYGNVSTSVVLRNEPTKKLESTSCKI